MENWDVGQSWKYHNLTKHSPASVRGSSRMLDWRNEPTPFKIYRGLEPLRLPGPDLRTGVPALAAIASLSATATDRMPNLQELAYLLYFSAGITKRKKYPGGEMEFRAASCTGALYHIELYLVCGDLPELSAGVYHFSPRDMSLRRLRSGDYRSLIAQATAQEEHVSRAPVIVMSTGTYWRNAWKYGNRTYRHFGWDNGTILANLLAMAAALDLPAHVVCGFIDDDLNRLLALDTDREVSLSLVALGMTSGVLPPAPPVSDLQLETEPLSPEEVDYPAMREMHSASCLANADEVRKWRDSSCTRAGLPPAPQDQTAPDSVEDVILRRGSSREFSRDPITFAQLSTILNRSLQGIPADFTAEGARLNDLYLIVHAVDGLAPGAYRLRQDNTLDLVRAGYFRKEAAFLGLEQDLPGDASVAVFFLADLNRCLDRFGNRGYRAVQLEAGILGGKMYLASYAQRLGATGLTFYDDEVTAFFTPHSAGKNAIFLMAIGHGVRRS